MLFGFLDPNLEILKTDLWRHAKVCPVLLFLNLQVLVWLDRVIAGKPIGYIREAHNYLF